MPYALAAYREEIKSEIFIRSLLQKPLYGNSLECFQAPKNETAILKKIPMMDLENIKQELRSRFPSFKFYVKYRGPRQSVGSSSGTCRKANAIYASIYLKEQ